MCSTSIVVSSGSFESVLNKVTIYLLTYCRDIQGSSPGEYSEVLVSLCYQCREPTFQLTVGVVEARRLKSANSSLPCS